MAPFIGERYWLVEAYLRTEATTGSYLGAFPEGDVYGFFGAFPASDVYGGFADADGDGRKDLLILVDQDTTCDDGSCDFFVFSLVIENRSLKTACDWHLVDKSRKPVTRGLNERIVTVDDMAVSLTKLPSDTACRLDGYEWEDYFHFAYRASSYDRSNTVDNVAIRDIRVGTYVVNGDGRDDVSNYVVPSPCARGIGKDLIIEADPQVDGSKPVWHLIGSPDLLGPAMTTLDGEALLEKARAGGCRQTASTWAALASTGGELAE